MKDLTDLIDDLTAIRAYLRLTHLRLAAAAEDSLVPPADEIAELRRQHNALGRLIAETDDLRMRLLRTPVIVTGVYRGEEAGP